MTTPTSPTPPPQMWPDEVREKLARWLHDNCAALFPTATGRERKHWSARKADDLLASNILPPASGAVDIILHCPKCGHQHVDMPGASDPKYNSDTTWTNPPHRSHLCHECGHIWRPADVATNGVAEIKTTGSNDSPQIIASEDEQLASYLREMLTADNVPVEYSHVLMAAAQALAKVQPAPVATMPTREEIAHVIETNLRKLLSEPLTIQQGGAKLADAILALRPTSTVAKPEPERCPRYRGENVATIMACRAYHGQINHPVHPGCEDDNCPMKQDRLTDRKV